MNTLQLTPISIQKAVSLSWTALIVGIIAILFSSCGQDITEDIELNNEASTTAMISHLEALGYHSELLDFQGDFVIYDDVVIAKESIIADMANPVLEEVDKDLAGLVYSRQRGVSISHALTYENTVSGLNVYVAPSILQDIGPRVLQSIYDAVDAIMAIENTSLNMQIVEDRADANITIASDLDATIFPETTPFYDVHPYTMLANVAFKGHAGPYISVDPKWELINYNTIKSAMMHELGHTIGLHHTGTESGEHIQHSPEDDELSIMSPVARNTGEFTVWDKKTIRLYYAEQLTRPTDLEISQKGSNITINYTNPKKTWQPYYWVRVYRYSAQGKLDAFKDFPAEVTRGNGAVTWNNQPNGEFEYRIKGMRFRKDVKSKLSLPVSTRNTLQHAI